MPEDGLANRRNVAAGREIHHRVGSVVNGSVQLLELFFNIRSDGRIADVGVDFAQRLDTDRHRLQFRMVDVRRNNHASASYFVAHQFRRNFFAVSDILHLLSHYAPPRVMHLGEVAVLVLGIALGQPLCPRFQNRIRTTAISAIFRITIARGHFRLYHPSED